MKNAVVDFLDNLFFAQTADELYAVSKAYFGDLGFRYVNVSYFQTETAQHLGMFSNMSQDWLSHYQLSGYSAIDPYIRMGDALDGRKVVSHDALLDCDSVRRDPVLQRLLLEGRQEGLQSSFLQCGVSRFMGLKAGINLILDRDVEELIRLQEEKRQELFVGAALAQSAFMACTKKEKLCAEYINFSGFQPRLSPREAEVVKWLAQGLRNDRIADKLKISTATVNFHIVSAKRRLDVKTREQLVAVAILQGIVEF
ncbi:helix-turn-helix transcriptional regulator [Shimia marina]|uniref:HTH-type quorum sensing-dependent transcriptional regulator VjbR n=1 Tax=Shimia marina TaxID=321267 RepID=A0A0P1EQ91_9RHOB|nr:LuxR family transcriptional regulator [Shimia marina]CUH52622.1 HTH-type quorum sensing-dependent transcriptional regulator VjbR [Shimia marina]SFE51943.1 DNA-binding transcriptional regulator, CsgD family [Shimia marina]